ncbi:hypothetical protein AR687_14795 [Flavobacteriaceae bacterium CRH]|nr:hypothetical protein AR687_14795 [Flavobacteriaceae bacterium CRH]
MVLYPLNSYFKETKMESENFRNSLKRLNKCDQFWDEMQPNEKGRLCQKCDKTIIDFSKMSFAEIAIKMSETNNATCGFYLPEQISEIKTSKISLPLSIGITTLIASTSLANSDTKEAEKHFSNQANQEKLLSELKIQPNNTIKDSILLRGRIEYYDSISKKNLTDSYAYVVIKETKIGCGTAENGDFKIKYLPNSENDKIILSIVAIGFERKEIEIKLESNIDLDLGVILLEKSDQKLTEFWITTRRRNFMGRVWQKIIAPFR